jgi:cytochrome oxidase Cu insertion factor (SCO1/SenC/PrrC family)
MVWGGLGLIVLTILLILLMAAIKVRVAMGRPLPVYGTIAAFSLTNQNAQVVTLEDLRGHVWVADIIFTRCAGPCVRMSHQMKDIQDGLPADSRAKLVSLTTDPVYDTPAVLKTYAARFGADSNRWIFLTGSQKDIARLATDSLKLTAIEKKPEERLSPDDLFIHSTILVLVDKRAQLRGIFETSGEGIDPARTRREILAGIRRLEREP